MCDKLIEEYKEFLSKCKTERECVSYFEGMLSGEIGDTAVNLNIVNVKNKALVVFPNTLSPGCRLNILCAHLDSPRLDVKQNPVRVDKNICYFDTHYYGGIRKYQWVAIPLAIHGVVCLIDGTVKNIVIGEDEKDPVFCISDLLPHLAQEQSKKSAKDFIDPEDLDVIIGNIEGDKDSNVKDKIYELLKEKYSIEKEDLLSSELEIVPAGKARDLGLDRSMVLGYGQDDRSCAYLATKAFIDSIKKITEFDKNIPCLLLVDKEEIGSVGNSGMDSYILENAIYEGTGLPYEYIMNILKNSSILSSDVTAAYDPKYSDVFDKESCAYLGKGPAFCKFTGSGGKSCANDANPEYIAKLRKLLKDSNIDYQMTEMSKVGVGGGGTIAMYAAKYGMDTIDVGVPLLSMHAPYEISSKHDLCDTWKLYTNFLTRYKD